MPLIRRHDYSGQRIAVSLHDFAGPRDLVPVAARLDHANSAALDYYLLPRLDFGQPRISLADQNRIEFESYRFDTLDYLYGMAERARLRRVA